jgi:hypothetical protein
MYVYENIHVCIYIHEFKEFLKYEAVRLKFYETYLTEELM